MFRSVSPRLAALGVVGVLAVVVVIALVGSQLGHSGAPSPGGTAGTPGPSGPAASAASPNPSEIAVGPTATPETTAGTGATPTPLPTPSGPPRVRALAPREVFGFLPYWMLGKPETQLPMDQLTTVAIFGVEAGKNGKLVRQTAKGVVPPGWRGWTSAATDDVLQKAHAAGVRVVLTVQRFGWTAGQSRKTVTLLSSAANRSTLAHEIAQEVTSRGADGVNLDFEPMPSAVKDDFTSFVVELRSQLDAAKPGLQLTFDTTTGINGWDLPALTADNAADAALVMGYDYIVANAGVAGSVDPLVSPINGNGLVATLEATLSQIGADRTILALPWYGRAWSTSSDQPSSGTLDQQTYGNSVTTEYGDAITLAQQNGRNYDVAQGSAWTAYRKQDCATCPETWRQLWYDDVDGMQAKEKLVVEDGLRGLGIWALGDDHAQPEVWATVRLTLDGGTDSKAPTGTAKVDPATVSQKHDNLPVVDGSLSLALTGDDGSKGTGVVFARVSAGSDLGTDGSLATGITYPFAASLSVPLADTRLGTGFAKGEGKLFVQWRDIAGNWSKVASVAFWSPSAVSATPSPLPSPGD